MVAFHCQQSIEKSFKAVLEEYEQFVPRIHDLITLRAQAEKYIRLTVASALLNQLNELYMDSRYPTDLGLLPSGRPPQDLAREMYNLARNICVSIAESMDQQGGEELPGD